MLFKAHPFPCSPSRPNQAGFWPVSVTVENALALFEDVHSFSVSFHGEYFVDALTTFLAAGGASGNIMSALGGLTVLDILAGAGFSNVTGVTKRAILESQYVPQEGEEVPPRSSAATANVCGPYPIHLITSSSGNFELNFGKCLNIQGQIAPYINITMSNNMSVANTGLVVGYIDFVNLGIIPIRGAGFATAYGYIKIKERYSDLALSTYVSKPKGTIIIKPKQGKTFTGFLGLTEVYLGKTQLQTPVPEPRGDSIVVSLPDKVESGYFSFVTQDAQGRINRFTLPDPLRVEPADEP